MLGRRPDGGERENEGYKEKLKLKRGNGKQYYRCVFNKNGVFNKMWGFAIKVDSYLKFMNFENNRGAMCFLSLAKPIKVDAEERATQTQLVVRKWRSTLEKHTGVTPVSRTPTRIDSSIYGSEPLVSLFALGTVLTYGSFPINTSIFFFFTLFICLFPF